MALAILNFAATNRASAHYKLFIMGWRVLGEASSYTCYHVTIPGFEAELVNLVPTNDARFVLGHLFTSCY